MASERIPGGDMDQMQEDTDAGMWAYVMEHPEEFLVYLSLPN